MKVIQKVVEVARLRETLRRDFAEVELHTDGLELVALEHQVDVLGAPVDDLADALRVVVAHVWEVDALAKAPVVETPLMVTAGKVVTKSTNQRTILKGLNSSYLRSKYLVLCSMQMVTSPRSCSFVKARAESQGAYFAVGPPSR